MSPKKTTAATQSMTVFREETVRVLARLDVNVERLIKRSDEDRESVKQVAQELRREFDVHAVDDKNHFIGVREEQKRQAALINRGVGGLALLQFVIIIVLAVLGLR